MLKVVATEKGEVVDEKVLVDDENKFTKEGIIVAAVLGIAALSILKFVLKLLFGRGKKKKKDKKKNKKK
ncbi:MAG: hypothetical protein KBS85_06360 [Lachnospiraceae bacterium]|nr:hypothetical protein [Candidatus Merdinaster equi]